MSKINLWGQFPEELLQCIDCNGIIQIEEEFPKITGCLMLQDGSFACLLVEVQPCRSSPVSQIQVPVGHWAKIPLIS